MVRACWTTGGKPLSGAWEQTPHCVPPYPCCLALTVASTDASPALCAPSTGWDVSWIVMLLLTVGQGFTILAVSIVLCRQRAQGTQCRGESQFPPRGKEESMCEWVGGRGLGSRLASIPAFSRGGGSKEYSSELSGDFSAAPRVTPSSQVPQFLSSNLKSRFMRTSIWPVSGEEHSRVQA